MQPMELRHKEYRQLISQLTVSSHLLFFTVLLTGSTPKTSDSSVATVNNNGLVTAKKAGTATITLTGANKLNHTCKVTVKAEVIKMTGVKLSKREAAIGETITVTLEPENANNIKSYQWYRIADDEKKKIEGATTAEYTLEKDDLEYILICVVTDQDNNEFRSEEIYTFEPYFEPSLE